MLEPLNRRHLLESLRPPEGYDLDSAIGTTFSLDLMTLLTVPLAFALLDWEDDEGRSTPDPLALLEAIRRYADRTHIFCQAGGIYLPRGNKLFLSHLEGVVHEVVAPKKGGVFHPKVWILRFVSPYDDDPVVYRVLVLSRNLTFDRSWDTLLLLEGELKDRTRAIRQSDPLGEFLAALPAMMIHPPTGDVRSSVRRVAHEIRRVRFELPEGFEAMRFHPLGIPGTEDWWFDGRIERMLTISPFVDPGILPELGAVEDGDVLVSRLDQLRRLPVDALARFKEVYFLPPEADPDGDAEDDDAVETDETLSGLHAKLYVADDGWKGRIWTGSANATAAAMRRNVEFLVELTGKKSFCGVSAILSQAKGETRFADMLSLYTPDDSQVPTDTGTAERDRLKLQIRLALASANMAGTVTATDDPQRFDIAIRLARMPRIAGAMDLTVKVWPVTIHEDAAQDLALARDAEVTFRGSSFESLTTFYGFETHARVGDGEITDRFVLNLPVEGMPTDRRERVLRSLLKSRNRVLQFLLYLLAEDGDITALTDRGHVGSGDDGEITRLFAGGSLLEPLVSALHRDPEKLDRVAKVVDDLRSTAKGLSLLPEGFMDVWEPVWTARREIWK